MWGRGKSRILNGGGGGKSKKNLLAQNPAPSRRCGSDGRTGHQEREEEYGHRNRDGVGTGTGMITRAGMGAKTGAGTGKGVEMGVEAKESLGTLQVVFKVCRKTREDWRRQRVTSNHSRKARRPSENVALWEGPEPWGRRRETGLGGAEKRGTSARNPRTLIYVRWDPGETWAEGEKNKHKKVFVRYMSTQRI